VAFIRVRTVTRNELPRDGPAIPFVTTSFALDLKIFLLLWPVWWILGIDQLVLPFFVGWESVRCGLGSAGRLSLSRPSFWACLLAIWWLIPVAWIEPEYIDLFLKEAATAWSQVLILILFWNTVRSLPDWRRIADGLEILGVYVAIGGLLYICGIWRGEFPSLMGLMLPTGLQESSQFFGNISVRSLGTTSGGGMLALRVSSLAGRPTAVSMAALVLIPFVGWRSYASRGIARWLRGLIGVGLMACLVFAESRLSYLALTISAFLLILFSLRLHAARNRMILLATSAAVMFVLILGAYLAYPRAEQIYQALVTGWRPAQARYRIYEETIRLLPEHWVGGWGAPQRIPGMPSKFSAGTHSSVLAMVFQHGVVGLGLYLALWLSLWRHAVVAFGREGIVQGHRSFMAMAVVALLALNIRELADSWWWDQLLVIVVWSLWGLVLTIPNLRQVGAGQRSSSPWLNGTTQATQGRTASTVSDKQAKPDEAAAQSLCYRSPLNPGDRVQ
jgi:hypothetical protein